MTNEILLFVLSVVLFMLPMICDKLHYNSMYEYLAPFLGLILMVFLCFSYGSTIEYAMSTIMFIILAILVIVLANTNAG